MRIRTTFTFGTTTLSDEELNDLFSKAGKSGASRASLKPFEAVELWSSRSDVEAFRRQLRALELDWGERVEHVYSDEELEMFPFLLMRLNTPERDSGGPAYGTEYDLSGACGDCAAGAVQTSALRFPETELPRRGEMFQTGSFEYVVSERLRNNLVEANVRGVELRQAQGALAGAPLPWFQIIPHAEMPPLDELTRGVDCDPCPVCRRSGCFDGAREPTQLVYRQKALADLNTDFGHTYEWFGYGVLREPLSTSRLPAPLILVSPLVLKVLRAVRVPKLNFQPVRFI